MLPYGRQSINADDIAAVSRVLAGDWLTTGPMVDAFEAALTVTSGAARVVSCTSGTAALHIAYSSIGIKAGDEVITTPLTFIATASSAAVLGAKITFADIDETGCLDPEEVSALASRRTKVVASVDYAGQPARLDELNTVAHRVGALTVEDAAHSIGSLDNGRTVGSISDLTTFSFFPTKNLTTAEGGAVASLDPELGRRAHEFHFIGMIRDRTRLRYPDEGPWHQEVHEFGLNYRLSDVLCALGLSQLERLGDFKARRSAIFARYQEAFDRLDGLTVPVVREDVDPIWHFYPIRVPAAHRRRIYEGMRAAGIGVQVNYLPVYLHPVFEDLGYKRGMCPKAEAFYAQEISLPLWADLPIEQVDRVIETLLSLL